MKSLLAALFVLGFAIATVHAQSDADETYLGIYNLIQQGDTAAANGQAQTAIDDYVSARNSLTVLHNGYPDWNPRIVLFRQKYLNERIDALHAENPNTVIQPVPAPAAAGNAAAAKPAETVLPAVTPAPAANGAPADWADQLASLRTQLQNAHSDNDTLSAKLKEALAARPAALDPAQLAAAREQLRQLQKENDLLKAGLDDEKKKNAAQPKREELEKISRELADADQKLARQQKHLEKVTAENDATLKKFLASDKALSALQAEADLLRRQVAEANHVATDLKAQLAEAKHAAADLQTQLTEARTKAQTNPQLEAELKALLRQYQDATNSVAQISAELAEVKAKTIPRLEADLHLSRQENETLHKQLTARPERSVRKLQAKLDDTQAQLQSAQAERETLQERIRELQNNNAATVNAAPEAATRLRDLTRERDELLAQLGEANLLLQKKKITRDDGAAATVAHLTAELETVRAELATFNLTPVPYTAEELALFTAPTPALRTPVATQMPATASNLVIQAEQHFKNQQLELAAADYQQILQIDTNNVVTLGNLAAIEINEGHYDQAEAHLRTALAQTPNDGYTVTQLGNVELHQGKYDEAVAELSRAVQISPTPDDYNYLGVALNHKGLRPQAEAAIRHAIQLAPAYGPAHLNLAEIYLDQQPPAPQLAYWHYQKALANGQSHSAGIEKQLAQLGVTVSQ